MPRKVRIQTPENEGFIVIGIASHERIWKICYELNNRLEISLRTRERPRLEAPDPAPPASLLPPSDLRPPAHPLEYYEDTESYPQVECLLCTANRRSLPPAARPFAFFFLLHHRENAALPWDSRELLARINASEAVISAVDLSHIKNIKLILP